MAFPTASELNAKYFGLTANLDLLNIWVSAMQEYLEGVGLSFTYTTETKKISSDLPQSAWIIPYCHVINSVTIKSFADVTYARILNEDEDYLVSKHAIHPHSTYKIELNPYNYNLYNYRIARPYYISIAGRFGFSDTLPAILELAIANIGQRYLSLASAGYQSINKSEIGDSKITLGEQPSDQAIIDMDFANIPTLQEALKNYILW